MPTLAGQRRRLLVERSVRGPSLSRRFVERRPRGRSKLKMLETAQLRNRTGTLQRAPVCLARAGTAPRTASPPARADIAPLHKPQNCTARAGMRRSTAQTVRCLAAQPPLRELTGIYKAQLPFHK